MHEMNLAKKIVKKAKKLGATKEIVISVGELVDVFPNEIKEVIERLSSFNVKVIEEKAKVKCECGFEGRPKILNKEHGFVFYVCPNCGKIPKAVKGNKIKIIQVK